MPRWIGYGTCALIVSAWFAGTLLLSARGVFAAPLGTPPAAMLATILGPPLLFALALRTSSGVRSFVRGVSPVFLTSVQGLRIFGGAFLFLYAFGHLPALFAWPAGWGDILVAVLAPFAAAAVAANASFLRRRRYVAFHILGLLDFVGAVGSGLLARGMFGMPATDPTTSILGQLPLSVIPSFAVPLWICLHLAALFQVADVRDRSTTAYDFERA